jgi:hypothetical protein
MATVKEVIEQTLTKVNGEYEAVVEGSDDWKTYLNVLNQVMAALAHQPYVKWQIFYDMNFTLGSVVDATLSYDIPTPYAVTIGSSPFDHVYFDSAGAVVDKYKIVDVAKFQATTDTRVCAVSGGKLWFKATASKIVGATIRVPAYKDPSTYTTGSQIVIIDSTPWLVAEMAGFICDSSPVPFIARNADKYHKEALIFMKEMRENNRRTQILTVKKLENQVGYTWADVMQTLTLQDL